MLNKNKEALSKVKELSAEQLLEGLRTLKDYDDIKSPVQSVQECKELVIALHNSDRDGMLGCLFERNPEGILAGALAVSKAFSAEKIIAFVRKEEEAEKLQDAAGKMEIALSEVKIEDLVNKRDYPDALFLHPAYLAAFADRLVGRTAGVILAEKNGEIGEFAYGSPWISAIKTKAAAYEIGNRFYTNEILDAMLQPSFRYGSGVIHPMEEGSCMIQNTQKALHNLRKDSCGRCTFCREGLYQLECIFSDAQKGRAEGKDLELIRELIESMSFLNNCSLGKNAAAPAESLLDNFAEEAEEHIHKKVCRSGKCEAYTNYCIDSSKCIGEGKCAEVCPEDAIEVKAGFTSVIDSFGCSHCGKCLEACANGAVVKLSGGKKFSQKAVRLKNASAAKKSEKASEVRTERDSKALAKLKRQARRNAKAVLPVVTQSGKNTQAISNRQERSSGAVKKLETDIVIIAGGPAGLAAAVAAGEGGARTILFDKANAVGGAANMGMGPLGIDTKIQRENFNNITVEEALKKHMEYTHYRVDEDLVSAYFHKSADTIEWLQKMGVEFFGAFRYFKESEATWHIVKADNGVIGPRAAGKMAKILAETAKKQGTQFYLETAATDLIVEDGKVVGAKALAADGTEIEARAKAVIVATGGFIGNKEMVAEEFGLHLQEDFYPFHMPGLQGDGLKMMWKAGAAKFGLNIEAIYQIPDNSTWSVLDGVLRQPNLLINQFGDRFMDEGDMGNTTYTGNALRLQPGNYGYCIMDRGILRGYQKNGPDIVDLVHSTDCFFEFDEVAKKAVEQKYMGYAQADTVEGLAEQIGIDPQVLQATMDEYNEMCENGLDTKFHKKRKFLRPITGRGGYICGKFYLGAYGTIGGVRINRYGEVLDENQIPIEGLYAAGTDANTIYGDSYNFTLPGNSMGFAVNTGRMAGEAAAEYVTGE